MTSDFLARLGRLHGYVIERELGGGGMSRVFLARETALDRRVAIKILETQGARVDAERFQREVMLSAQLTHPHIVPLLVAGEIDGLAYYVMPYVDGESLRARLRDGALPIGEAIRLLRNIAAALTHAHARGIVHRDIKPDNVIVTSGIATVLDFGVSKALSASAAAPRDGITGAGLAIGTPRYMAPEQVAGDPDLDGRADLYAWGTVAYELLTGATPFGGSDPVMILRAHLSEVPAPITNARAGIPPVIASLVMQCLEKDRTRRPVSAQAILDLLDTLSTPSGLRTLQREESGRWRRSRLALIPALFYLVASLLTVAGLFWLRNRGEIGERLPVLATVATLLGFPAVVGAGLVAGIRRDEREA